MTVAVPFSGWLTVCVSVESLDVYLSTFLIISARSNLYVTGMFMEYLMELCFYDYRFTRYLLRSGIIIYKLKTLSTFAYKIKCQIRLFYVEINE